MAADPKQVKSVFLAAVEKPDAERAAFLDQACAGDAELRDRVEELLGCYQPGSSILHHSGEEPPAHEIGTHLPEKPANALDSAGPDGSADGAATAAQAAFGLYSGLKIGPYKLLEQIGEGGMGTVWMAEQQKPVRRMVALKVIKPGMDSAQVLARFEAERQALALMDHPNIARVLDAGATGGFRIESPKCEVRSAKSEDRQLSGADLRLRTSDFGLRTLEGLRTPEGRPYFVMELVKGIPITKYCDENHLTPRERLELFTPVCHAIQHAHQKGIIHRDIKPSNVFVASYDGKPVPKVIDFGVAKAAGQKLTERTLFTGFGAMIGTLEYMSPEQACFNALDVDTRSDIYGLGVLLYELLTGTTPLTRNRLKQAALEEALRLIREEEPPRPSTRLSDSKATLASVAALRKTEPVQLTMMLRGDPDWIVMKALEKDRGRRYETANGLARDIDRYLHDEPVEACPPSAWYRLRKFARRNKSGLRTALAAAAVVLVAVVGIGWTMWDRAADTARRMAETEQTVNVALGKADELRGRASAITSATLLEADTVLSMWDQAEAAVGQAKAALRTGTPDDGLQQRVLAMQEHVKQGRGQAERRRDQSKRKEKLLRDLDDARMALTAIVDDRLDYATAGAKFVDAFTTYGLEMRPDGAKELARRIRAEEPAVRVALIVALDVWAEAAADAKTRWSARDLRALASMADDDPWRQKFRAASSAKEGQELLNLSAEARRPTMSPANLYLLALSLERANGNQEQKKAQRQEAITLLRWALNRHPTDFWIALQLGSRLFHGALINEGEEVEEAAGCFRVALALRPNASDAYNSLGRCLSHKGQKDEAIAAFRKAIEISPTNGTAYRDLGAVLWEKKELDEAITACRKAIEINSKLAMAYSVLGRALQAKKQLHEAIEVFRQVIEIYPKTAVYYRYLGNALWDNKQTDEAIAVYKEEVRNLPDSAPSHWNLGMKLAGGNIYTALACQGSIDEAIGAFRKAVQLDPKAAEWQNLLAWMLDNFADPRYRDCKSALAYAKNAVNLNPENSSYWNTLGNACYRNGEYKAALEALNKAAAIGKGNRDYCFWLAMTHWQVGDKDQARIWYDKGVSGRPVLQKSPGKTSAVAEAFERYRAEAAELLGIQAPPSPSKDAPLAKKKAA